MGVNSMKRQTRRFSAIGVASGLLFCVAAISGCSNQPRRVDGCAIGGAVVGTLIGTGGGFAIAHYPRSGHIAEAYPDMAATDSLAGAAIGAVAGGVAGHY